jgi:hypothetical protein
MDDFVHALSSWGVLPFSILLIAAFLYWLLVMLGALDLDMLNFGHEHDSAASDHDHHPGFFSGLLEFLSIGKVPLTIIVSMLVVFGWLVAMASELILPLWGALDAIVALAVAFPLTGLACRPLRVLFQALDGGVKTGVHLLGREARITSATCDEHFGTASCPVPESDDLLLNVVASRPGLVFRRDEIVVIADYDATGQRYVVGPAAYLLPPSTRVEAEVPPSPVLPPVSMPIAAALPFSSTPSSSTPRQPLSQ